jgi:hypothetical protein
MSGTANKLKIEESLDGALFDDEEAMTPSRMNEIMRSYSNSKNVADFIPSELAAEMAEVQTSFKEAVKKTVEENKPEVLSESDLTISGIKKMFKVNRISEGYESGPRNFYDHPMSLEIQDQFRATLQTIKNPDFTNIGALRKEFKEFDTANEFFLSDKKGELNKSANDLMRKTHDREMSQHPGDTELQNQHKLERDYFKLRLLDDEKLSKTEKNSSFFLMSGEGSISKTDLPEVKADLIKSAEQYLSDHPKFAQDMTIGLSFIDKDVLEASWKSGLRDFHGSDKKNELNAFRSRNDMVDAHGEEIRSSSKADRPTLIMQINIEQTYFNYQEQKQALAENPSESNSKRFNDTKSTIVELMTDFKEHLAEKNGLSIGLTTTISSQEEPSINLSKGKSETTEKYREKERDYFGHRLTDEQLDVGNGIVSAYSKGRALGNVEAMRQKFTPKQ